MYTMFGYKRRPNKMSMPFITNVAEQKIKDEQSKAAAEQKIKDDQVVEQKNNDGRTKPDAKSNIV